MTDTNAPIPPLSDDESESSSPLGWLKRRKRMKNDNNVRDAIENLLDGENEENALSSSLETKLDIQEKTLISNVLSLSNLCAVDVMIPRADIVAIDINATHADILALLGNKPHNRIPVYRETMDDIVGCITVKDILKYLAQGKEITIVDIMRDVLIVSPAIPVLDLMLEMRNSKKHLAMVIDEFGGIDGLVAIGDLVEAVVGEINDEHDNESNPEFAERPDGSVIIDARVEIDEFEERYNTKILHNEEDREDIDTLGGLAMAVASHLPTRGEILCHEESGIIMEILDADPRRVKRICVSNIPKKTLLETD